MGPCVYCHRRSITASPDGPLYSVYAADAVEEARTDGADPCRFPDPCRCAECAVLDGLFPDDEL